MTGKKKLIAVDIGGVCVRLELEARLKAAGFASLTEVPKSAVEAVAMADRGAIETSEFLSLLQKSLPQLNNHRKWYCGVIGSEFENVGRALRGLKEEWDFAFLSDISAVHLDYIAKNLSFFSAAVGGVYSFEAKCCKPDDRIFEIFEARFGLPDLYVDDRQENIDAAKKRQWNAVLYDGTQDLKKLMNEV